tara:strand:- start:409 stop:684 length:276 start_codon:yes stop_codon:yes gene_type:complete
MKTHDELMKLTKVQLEEYGRTLGVELDRRKKKDRLVSFLLDAQEIVKPVPVMAANTSYDIEGSVDDAIEDVVEEVSGWYDNFIKWIKNLFK